MSTTTRSCSPTRALLTSGAKGATDDVDADRAHHVAAAWNERGTPKLTVRSAAQAESLFDGLELLEPGVVSCSLWRVGPARSGEVVPVAEYCGVGRKPLRT